MRRLLAACGLAWAVWTAAAQTPVKVAPVHFVNGLWFNGTGFEKADWYAVDGVLTHRPVKAAETVDLHGGYVVPPYGDAHEHNFDSVEGTRTVAANYLRDGIFYAQGMTDNPEGAAATIAAGLVDTPTTPDVTYAHGGLTGVNGHPKEVYESLANGFYYPQTDAQRKLVIEGHKRAGKAYWEVPDAASLQAQWPAILASKPDQIKVFLASADHFKQATADDPQLGKGIDPALVKPIVQLAHAAGLRVFVHVDTAYDFHVALLAGADGMAHLPGYGISAKDDASLYRIPDADIALTAKQHVVVIATASIADGYGSPEDLAARRQLSKDNLGRMKAAGVTVLLGSDRYGSDSVKEADYLQSLGVWTNAEMLRMWSVETPQSIFPKREIGEFEGGFQASLLVLDGDPTKDWTAVHRITDRWKQGRRGVTD
jgi:cytosine/adenosine deaminase-related metal-dependent hydrolase